MEQPLLIVDDDPQVRHLLKLLLTRQGYSIVEASDGCRALALIHGMLGQIAALVTDIDMPGMNGLELAISLRRLYPELPVLFISSSSTTPEELNRAAPGSCFLAKPCSQTQVVEAMTNLLNRRSSAA